MTPSTRHTHSLLSRHFWSTVGDEYTFVLVLSPLPFCNSLKSKVRCWPLWLFFFPFFLTLAMFTFPIPFSTFLVSSLKRYKQEVWRQEAASVGSGVTTRQGQDSLRSSYFFFLCSLLLHVAKWLKDLQALSLQDTGRKERCKGWWSFPTSFNKEWKSFLESPTIQVLAHI